MSTDVKPLTAEEERELREYLDPLRIVGGYAYKSDDTMARLLATLDAERAARAKAEAKNAQYAAGLSETREALEAAEDATAKRIADWLRPQIDWRIVEAIERGDWRR